MRPGWIQYFYGSKCRNISVHTSLCGIWMNLTGPLMDTGLLQKRPTRSLCIRTAKHFKVWKAGEVPERLNHGTGPAFKKGHTHPTFNNVDLYPLMAEISGLIPAEVDGKMENVEAMLVENNK